MLHRDANRRCLEVPKYPETLSTLAEVQDSPLRLQVETRVFGHPERLNRTPSAGQLFSRLLYRSQSLLGRLAGTFETWIGPPTSIPTTLPPYRTRYPHNIHTHIPNLARKSSLPDTVNRALVGSLLHASYPDHPHVFTGASVAPRTSSETAAVSIPSLDRDWSGWLSLMTTLTTAELKELRLDL